MSEISNNQLAQKVDDLAAVVENLARATNEGFKEIREEMHEGFASVKSELKEDMKEMKTELRAEMKDMKEELIEIFNRKDEQNKEDIRHLYTITGRLS